LTGRPPVTREELENLIRGFASALEQSLHELTGQKIGYCLMLFDFGDSGSLAYGSNADREDMIKTLAEFRQKLQASRA
jgi:hypothetical protein